FPCAGGWPIRCDSTGEVCRRLRSIRCSQRRSRAGASMRRVRRMSPVLVLLLLTPAAAARAQQLPYRDPKLAIERRVSDLLARMTLEEKVAQMLCLWDQKKLI